MKEKFDQLKDILEGMQGDIEKFYVKEVNSAGGRLRKELNNIRKLSAELRKDIQEIRNQRKPPKKGTEV